MEAAVDDLTGPHPLRAQFPVVEELVYLDHAAIAPLCRPAADAITCYVAEQSKRGIIAEFEYFPVGESARARLAALINASPDEIAWTANTATSISHIANGIAFQPGDNVVVCDEQFPCNVVPWLGLRQDGVETRMVSREGPGVPLERIAAHIDARTRLVDVSWVEFNSGYVYDLTALAALCHERGALLLVDAIQGLGALQLDVQATGVDFVAAGMQKWLLGPTGLGLLYVRHSLLNDLRPRFANFRGVVNPYDSLNYDQPLVDAARRFEASTLPTMSLIGADAALALIAEAGPAVIERRVLALAQLLADRLREHGHTLITPADPVPSSVVCFHPRNGSPEDMVHLLADHKIAIAARTGLNRISPHFYNTAAEIETLFVPGLLGS